MRRQCESEFVVIRSEIDVAQFVMDLHEVNDDTRKKIRQHSDR